jgi:hypothetical protein
MDNEKRGRAAMQVRITARCAGLILAVLVATFFTHPARAEGGTIHALPAMGNVSLADAPPPPPTFEEGSRTIRLHGIVAGF